MATQSQLNQQLTSTNNALAVLQQQLAAAKPGSADQTKLTLAIYDLQQQQKSVQQQLSTYLPSSDPVVKQTTETAAASTSDNSTASETSTSAAQAAFNQQFQENASNMSTVTVSNGVVVAASPDAIAKGVKIGEPPPADMVQKIDAVSVTKDQEQATSSDPGIAAQGVAYDEDGYLMPGYTQDEFGTAYYEGFPKEQEQPLPADDNTTDGIVTAGALDGRQTDQIASDGTEAGIQAEIDRMAAEKNARSTSGGEGDRFKQNSDWRVKLSLAPSAKYFYRTARPTDILYPLKETDGVVFPYTPSISTNYRANYDPADITHSNYKLFFYKNSSIDDIGITAEFTAQDTTEANYLLAVIHFFKSVTKMFYGQDSGRDGGPKAGTPPPLCYLSGLGAFQFDNHPLLITSFGYSLPNDVDYVRAGSISSWGGASIGTFSNKQNADKYIPGIGTILGRLQGSKLQFGGASKDPEFKTLSTEKATYVPTKMQIQLSAIPVVTRNDISNQFSLSKYAKGELSQGSKRNSGGIW